MVVCGALKLTRQPYYRWRNSPTTDTEAYRTNALHNAAALRGDITGCVIPSSRAVNSATGNSCVISTITKLLSLVEVVAEPKYAKDLQRWIRIGPR